MAVERAIIAGAGGAGLLHAITYRAAGVRIAAIFDPDPSRASALASMTGADVVSSLAELAAIDADYASITSPPLVHVEQATSASRGAPARIVFVEKPVATDLAGLAQLATLGTCVPVVQWRVGRGSAIARRALKAGLFGPTPFVEAELAWNRDDAYFASGRASRARWGCGVLLSVGVHAVDLACSLLDAPIDRVSGWLARAARHPPTVDVETTADLTIDFSGGARASVRASFDGGPGTTRFVIRGERGVRCVLSGSETDPTYALPTWSGLDVAEERLVRRIERDATEARDGAIGAPLLVPFLHRAMAARRAGHAPGDVGALPSIADVAPAHRAILSLYDEAPERFPHGAPSVALPPARVAINPLVAPVVLVKVQAWRP